jgi:diacylglycerol kinase (ATP)
MRPGIAGYSAMDPEPAPPAAASPAAPAAPPHARHEWVLLSNPRSFRMSMGDRLERLESLAADRGIPVLHVSDAESIAEAVAEVADAGAANMAVAGGDGTLQAVVTELLQQLPFERRPAILILGGGRTNLIARDLASRGEVGAVFARAVGSTELRRARRAVLQLRQDDGFSQHGFFLAGALVDEVIRDCHAYRAAHRDALRTGHTATAWRLPQLAVLAALGKRRFQAPALAIEAGRLGRLDGPVRLLLATTLRHADGLYDPYAARGEGALRLTAVRAGAAGFWRRLPRLVTGRYSAAMRPGSGYLSGRCAGVSIIGLRSLTLDGQEHHLDPARPVEFSAPDEIEFLVP